MEVARNRNSSNSWSSSGSGKGSMLEASLKQRNGIGLESPLATQLQQAWLETQLPKRNVPRIDFLSPLPSPDFQFRGSPDPFQQQLQQLPQQTHQYARASSRSSSFSQESPTSILSHPSPRYSPDAFSETYSGSEGGSAVNGGGQDEVGGDESEPMEDDMMLQYVSDMLMDEEMADQKCMYVQCSAYHAMTKELADLIGDASPADDDVYGCGNATPAKFDEAEKDTAVNSWIDEVLNSNPQDFFLEEQTGESLGVGAGTDFSGEVSSIADGITNISTGSPKSRSTGSTPNEAAPAPEPTPSTATDVDKCSDAYDCPYLDNDRPANAILDYTNGRSGIESLADLYPLLMQCAQAVATDNVGEAHQLISHLRQKTSPFGDGGQRMAFYIVEALVARLSGTGAQLYTALSSSRPSAQEMLKAYRMFVQCNPLPRVAHYFANATILKTAQGLERIHIVDYGILYGVQWPCLLKKLSIREGGPPHVRITGIDFAQPGSKKNDRVEETGRRLQAKAKEFGVELEFHAIAGKWENITAAQLQLRDDETLFVNCIFRLRNLLDETVMASSPRKMVLSRIHSLNPKVFLMGVINAGYNSPFFMARFRETINHFSALFDAIHTTVPPDVDLRRLTEKEILGRQILNIIACEGTERIERAETHRQWQSRSINAGFKQLPLDPAILNKAQDFLKNYNRNYGIAVDGNWLLSGWRDRVLHGLTAWTCA
ncbi:unnamed protein product [Calypogeia fissa]